MVSRVQVGDDEVVIKLVVGGLAGLAWLMTKEDPLGRAAASHLAPARVTRGDHPWQAWS